MKMKLIMSVTLCFLSVGLLLEILTAAEPVGRQPDSPFAGVPTNMLVYLDRMNTTLRANTAATNMTDKQVLTLMDEAAKTNLGAELWRRSSIYSYRASMGADIAITVRVLEDLRAGRTNDAIHRLEAKLDDNVSGLGMFLDASTTMHMPISNHLDSLQIAKDYWQKFPRATGNPSRDDSVSRALLLLDKK